MKVEYLKTADVKPYRKNAKKHPDKQVDQIANSIREFGFRQPLVVDMDNVLVIGHGRLLAAQKLGMDTVPCVRADDLTEEQIKALRLADNKTNESEWEFDLLTPELNDIVDIDMSQFGFDYSGVSDWFERKTTDGKNRQEGNEEYNEFLDKFEDKKTTDDCYTPPNIYDAVADWVAAEYGVKKEAFARPFYPGGDYQKENYHGKIVVDNPPFSILSEIEEWFNEHGVKYFLFAPSLTNFPSKRKCCAVCVGVSITYENGATVATSFVTNMEDLAARTAPELYKNVDKVNKDNTKGRELPSYEYPPQVVTATMLCYLSKYGQDFRLAQKDASEKIGCLDEQKIEDKTIFGGGFLISEKAAAEKAAAEKAAAEKAAAEKAAAEKAAAEKAAAKTWKLSDREKEIIRALGRG